MPLEIERKLLLANDDWKSWVTRRIRIRDGLIASNNGNKARVRISDSNATITLKSRRRGPSRTEFEYPISYSDAEEMLRAMCDGQVLDKVRHLIIHAGAVSMKASYMASCLPRLSCSRQIKNSTCPVGSGKK